MQIRTLVPPTKIVQDLNDIQRRVVPKATARALNRTNARIRTLTARKVAARFKLSAKKAKAAIAIPKWRRATARKLNVSGGVFILVRMIDAPSSGASVTIHKGRKVRRWTGKFPSFRTKLPSGHVGIFVRNDTTANSSGLDRKGRKRRGRLPIDEVYTDQTRVAFQFAAESLEITSREWDRRFTQELNFFLGRTRGGGRGSR